MPRQITQCRECEWSVAEEERGTREHVSLVLDHAIATGHGIDTMELESSPEGVVSAFFR